MGAGVSTNPHFPRVRLRCRLGHAHPPLADRVQTRALRLLPVPSRVPIKHCCLAVPCRVPVGYRYPARFPFAVPLPESCGSTGRFGKWERHWLSPCLTLLPRSPCLHFNGVHPCGCPTPWRWQRPEAFNRCRSAASGHKEKLSPFPESHKRKPPVDKMYNGDKYSACRHAERRRLVQV